jgi:hypothetical protein
LAPDAAMREYNAYLAQLTQADEAAKPPADAADTQNRTTA